MVYMWDYNGNTKGNWNMVAGIYRTPEGTVLFPLFTKEEIKQEHQKRN